ncbi:uncharacterized protein BdWA1_003696 [Babesia duncani]|nr:hypothetical protein BdWA1_003696 [Babesia duncani]
MTTLVGINRVECRQYTLLVGLRGIEEEYVDDSCPDLITLKERLMRKVLNINNYIKSLCDYYEKKSSESTPKKVVLGVSLERLVRRNEFFVYSASVRFNPKIQKVQDIFQLEDKEGSGVVTLTVKLPSDAEKQGFYLRLILKCISKNALVLKMHEEQSPALVSNATHQRTQRTIGANGGNATTMSSSASTTSSSLRYFDDDRFDEGPQTGHAYSFFNQSRLFLAKYATSHLALNAENEKFVSQRLAREKEKTRLRHVG